MRKTFNKLSLMLIFIMMISIIPMTTYANESDGEAPSNWAKAEIDKAEELKLIPNKIQGEYKKSITREEFSELAINLYEVLSGEVEIVDSTNPFNDTENQKVIAASNLGIVQGKGDGQFAPDNAVTRQEISVMLYRTLQAAKPDYNYPNLGEYIFTDYSLISSWAREAVSYLYGVGVINGTDDNRFDPKGNTSREEAIVLVKRMYEKVLDSQETSMNKLVVSRSNTSRQSSVMKYKLENLIAKEMGKPYQWGGTGPNGYDCSGLVYSIYGKLDIKLPRTSKTQASAGTYVAKEDLNYGDLVFFARDGKNINHVGIYVGDGEFVHSPQTGDVVKATTLTSGYYAKGYYTARRVLPQ